jgi:hypothetical protein
LRSRENCDNGHFDLALNITHAIYNYALLEMNVKAGLHCSRFARAGGAGFENLLTRGRDGRQKQ